MTGERFRVLWGYAMSPQMKPWIAELANGFGVEREYAERECAWSASEYETMRKSGCGEYFRMDDPIDLQDTVDAFKFCPYCGGKIVESDDG